MWGQDGWILAFIGPWARWVILFSGVANQDTGFASLPSHGFTHIKKKHTQSPHSTKLVRRTAITLRRKLWTFKYNCKWCYIGIWGNRNRFSWKYINIYLSLSQNIGNVFPICSLKRWFSFCPNIYILSVGFLECWLSDGFPQLSDIR